MEQNDEICISEQNENKKMFILGGIIFIVLMSLLVVTINIKVYDKPEPDKAVQEGVPVNIDEQFGYSELAINDGYSIAICGKPEIKNKNKMYLYATNMKENKIWFKIQVFDSEDKLLGETGLIKPNQYVESVELKKEIKTNKVKIKIVEYEIETYQNKGKVTLNIEL